MSVAGETGLWSAEAGDPAAPVIALVHGSMDRSGGMLKLSRRLDDRFRVLRYDRRGYGRSRGPWTEFAMAAQVDDLLALLDGRPAVVIGHSYGGNVALAAAERRADRVRGVAVFEAPMSWEPWWPEDTAGGEAVTFARSGAADDSADVAAGPTGAAAERFLRRMLGHERWARLPEATKAERRAEGAALVGELTDLSQSPPWTAPRIDVPVVVAFGALGASHHRLGAQRMVAALRGASLLELAGCRHDAPSSHPDQFCTLVVEPLLARVGGPWSVPHEYDGGDAVVGRDQ